jgi:hypothetical protein
VGAGAGWPTLQDDAESRLVNACGSTSCATFRVRAWERRVSGGATDMTVLDFLVVICFVVPVGAAISAAGAQKAGIGGLAAALIAGSLIGIGFASAMWWQHDKLAKYFPAASGVIWIAALILDFAWMVIAGFVGGAATSAVFYLFR